MTVGCSVFHKSGDVQDWFCTSSERRKVERTDERIFDDVGGQLKKEKYVNVKLKQYGIELVNGNEESKGMWKCPVNVQNFRM